MRLTDTELLPFPDCTDPGDGALDLQVLAEAIDAKLVASFANFRKVVNVPCALWTLSVNATGFVNGDPSPINFDQLVFQSPQLAVTGPSTGVLIYTPGYYFVGMFLNASPSGGTTANADVTAMIEWKGDLNTPIGAQSRELFLTRNYLSVSASESATVCMVVRQEFDGTALLNGGGLLTGYIWHQNAASTMTVNATSRLWAFKICDLEDN